MFCLWGKGTDSTSSSSPSKRVDENLRRLELSAHIWVEFVQQGCALCFHWSSHNKSETNTLFWVRAGHTASRHFRIIISNLRPPQTTLFLSEVAACLFFSWSDQPEASLLKNKNVLIWTYPHSFTPLWVRRCVSVRVCSQPTIRPAPLSLESSALTGATSSAHSARWICTAAPAQLRLTPPSVVDGSQTPLDVFAAAAAAALFL